jgi:uroporphyrinogen-III decarboxylase
MVGNLDAMELLKNGTCEQVKQETLNCFREAGAETAYMASAAGGLAPGTPKRNVQAVADAADEYGREAGF